METLNLLMTNPDIQLSLVAIGSILIGLGLNFVFSKAKAFVMKTETTLDDELLAKLEFTVKKTIKAETKKLTDKIEAKKTAKKK